MGTWDCFLTSWCQAWVCERERVISFTVDEMRVAKRTNHIDVEAGERKRL